jgi:photosystem I subunit 3
MKRYFLPFTTALFFLGLSLNSYAGNTDSTNTLLIPCKDSVEFNRGFEGIIEGLEKRKEVYEKGTPGYDEIEGEIGRTRESFEVYKNCICGALDGLPHLIADGGTELYGIDTSGDLLIPSAIFIYIAGYIGWAGRRYLIYIRGLEKEIFWKREIIIDVPAASYIMLTCFLWPLDALDEYLNGKLIVGDEYIYRSKR